MKMNLIKTFLLNIGHVLLSIVRTLRRVICCKRKRETEHLLPLTVHHIEIKESQMDRMHEFNSQWESWPDTSTSLRSSSLSSSNIGPEKNLDSQSFQEEDSANDFFKDMVPQIRKPKKIYVIQDSSNQEEPCVFPNRLAMDPKAILSGPDLGTIEDNPTNWEDTESMDDSWDADILIKETKRVEREKRLAEHQRRKLEKESRRALKQELSTNSLIMSLSDLKEKAKSS